MQSLQSRVLESDVGLEIQRLSKEAYLNALENWNDSWRDHGTIDQIAKSRLQDLSREDLLYLAGEVSEVDILDEFRKDLRIQSESVLEWILSAATSGTQDDTLRVATYITGVYIPLMITDGRQHEAMERIEFFVGESQVGFRNVLGMTHRGMSDEVLKSFDITRAESKRYRYLMLAPMLMSMSAYYDPEQTGVEPMERTLDSFKGEFVSPCTLLRIGLLAMLIGSTDRSLLQRCICGAKRVGEDKFAQQMIDYLIKLG